MSVIAALANAHDRSKGPLLESVVCAMLSDFGFLGVRRQFAGSQHGFDVMAHRMSTADSRAEVWKFECKNVSEAITLNDLAPKLIWQCGRATIDYFVVVSVSDVANDVLHALDTIQLPMPVVLWTGRMLAELIESSPSACRCLDIPSVHRPTDVSVLLATARYPAHPVYLDVVHSMDPPREFAYMLREGEPVKGYTDTELHLLACLTNRANDHVDVVRLSCATEAYAASGPRTLRLLKPKGFFAPPRYRFRPSRAPGSETDVIHDQVWRVDPRRAEIAELVLSGAVSPGWYQISFRGLALHAGAKLRLRSASLILRCGGAGEDLRLVVMGRHYDSAAAVVLGTDEGTWRRLCSLAADRSSLLYLGPTHYHLRRSPPATWCVYRVSGRHSADDTMESDPSVEPELVWDSGQPIKEELYSLQIAAARVQGVDGWQDLLPVQLDRRGMVRL